MGVEENLQLSPALELQHAFAVDRVGARERRAPVRENDAVSLLDQELAVLRRRVAAADNQDVFVADLFARDIEMDLVFDLAGNGIRGLLRPPQDSDGDHDYACPVILGGRFHEQTSVGLGNDLVDFRVVTHLDR